MSKKTFRESINEAIKQEMRRDENVIVLGEDVAGGAGTKGDQDAWGGPMAVTKGLAPEVGRERVIDTPIPEGAIIGTAATAGQGVPHLGESAEKLYVFQRTPSSIDVRNNQPTDPNWISTQQPGWHNERRKNFETLLTGGVVKEDLVSDGWTEAFRLLFSVVSFLIEKLRNP